MKTSIAFLVFASFLFVLFGSLPIALAVSVIIFGLSWLLLVLIRAVSSKISREFSSSGLPFLER